VLQVTSAEVGINGLTNIVTDGAMLGVALANVDVHWWALQVLLALVLGAVFIKVAVNLVSNSVSFWLSGRARCSRWRCTSSASCLGSR
jgi:ABC-2 type transport system permease protein